MRQYKLVQGPFPSESVFTGEIGRLKSYERQKPYVGYLISSFGKKSLKLYLQTI